ncbi:MAG TPA: hypothetical protein VMB02_08915, partial [Candidatus Aquilonibacter sp.]|nr:hypothetical protein [Candidatus Aquilonibacter sp.]
CFWYAVMLLYPLTYITMAHYQNYVTNVYLWLCVGIIFALPGIAARPAPPAAARVALVEEAPPSSPVVRAT